MNKEFIKYEQALALKELGFDEPCLGHYDNPENSVWITDSPPYYAIKENVCLAPLYQQAFRWFIEKHGLFGIILPHLIIGNQWYYKITNRNNSSGLPFEEGFGTYGEAELECLKKLIEAVKNKQE
jgi:hypothetical protein